MAIKRIKYVSRFAQPLGADDISSLAQSSSWNNLELDVTGVLMTSGGLFFQILEGPAESVDIVFSRIVADPRHTDLLILSSEDSAADRLFPDWSMKTLDLDAASHVRLLPLKALIKAVFDQQRLLDNMTWAIERSLQYEMSET